MNDQAILLRLQRNEITEHFIYARLARLAKESKNREILEEIAGQEKSHYEIWKKHTGRDIGPSRIRIACYIAVARVLGLSFGLRLMESWEQRAADRYENMIAKYPEAALIVRDEEAHEQKLIGILNDRRLVYAGSVILGLNDALVEFTGTLAGLTLALSRGQLIGLTGIILGIAASLSMASSEYLSQREDADSGAHPLKSALYTGTAYAATVVLLVSPYFIFENVFHALGVMAGGAMLVIFLYTFYMSVARGTRFWPRFLEMAAISLGVAIVSFFLGWGVKHLLGVDV